MHDTAARLWPAAATATIRGAVTTGDAVSLNGATPVVGGAGYTPHLRIRDMARTDLPRERLRTYGAATLSNAELLAIVLRTGTSQENVLHLAERLLSEFGDLGGLYRASVADLEKTHGIGPVKAVEIHAALALGPRLAAFRPDSRPSIGSPEDVFNLIGLEMGLLQQEHLRVLLLNTRNEVLRIQDLYKGSVNTAQVRVAEVLRPAIQENAPAIVVVHNHPSGDPSPSEPDVAMTREVYQAGRLLDIAVLDHIIIGQGTWRSMKELGLGFPR